VVFADQPAYLTETVEVERFRDVLLDVWREACRHIDISESAATLAALLARQLPLAGLIVRRLDQATQTVTTIASGTPDGLSLSAHSRTVVPANRWARLQSWVSRGAIVRSDDARRPGDLSLLVPTEQAGAVLVGPLAGPDEHYGALVVVAPPDMTYRQLHEDMFLALLEPFAVALENDRRLHELTALRAAAEADRRSLLTRLGRADIQDAVVGAETGLKTVLARVQLVAASDVPVLILGETGTGKEVIARAIHARSTRAAGPFIRVNCGAIPPELVDSQLFGHERGSFTGATETRQGWFERADGGTLFLDETGELPLPAQVRLLRVLQDGFIERVGGQQPLRVDVRMVAATHRDLALMVKARTFREDLWYRINVFPLQLPPLRERPQDIPALAQHFAHRAATRFGLAYVEPADADLKLLLEYAWPGNIRELGAVIDRAAILGEGQRLAVATALGFMPGHTLESAAGGASLDEKLRSAKPAADRLEPGAPVAAGEPVASLDLAMRQHMERALVASRGRIEGPQGAAAILKINPHTLRARMRKLGVRWSEYRG